MTKPKVSLSLRLFRTADATGEVYEDKLFYHVAIFDDDGNLKQQRTGDLERHLSSEELLRLHELMARLSDKAIAQAKKRTT